MGHSNTCCTGHCEEEDAEDEKRKGLHHREQNKWEIKEWCAELRQNDITMMEYNLERIEDIRKSLEVQRN